MVGLEFGSGSSSKFFASRIQKLVSIEHHKGWYTHVHQWMDENGLENIDYRYIAEKSGFEPQAPPHFFDRLQLIEKDYRYKKEFWDYFHVSDEFEDRTFDFILVDGRARVACLLNSLPKLKPGGLMILDNSDRPSYQLAFKVLKDWEHFTCTTGLSDTTFWIKP